MWNITLVTHVNIWIELTVFLKYYSVYGYRIFYEQLKSRLYIGILFNQTFKQSYLLKFLKLKIVEYPNNIERFEMTIVNMLYYGI